MSARNFLKCHPERRGRRGDLGVEGTLWAPAVPDVLLCKTATPWFSAAIGVLRLRARLTRKRSGSDGCYAQDDTSHSRIIQVKRPTLPTPRLPYEPALRLRLCASSIPRPRVPGLWQERRHCSTAQSRAS